MCIHLNRGYNFVCGCINNRNLTVILSRILSSIPRVKESLVWIVRMRLAPRSNLIESSKRNDFPLKARTIPSSLLRLHLDQIDALDATLARIDKEVDSNVEPFA
jgi:hypothetical protein